MGVALANRVAGEPGFIVVFLTVCQYIWSEIVVSTLGALGVAFLPSRFRYWGGVFSVVQPSWSETGSSMDFKMCIDVGPGDTRIQSPKERGSGRKRVSASGTIKLFHQSRQGNHCHLFPHRKFIVPTVKDEFMRCADILAGFAIVLAQFGSNAMLDLDGPDFSR